ncbi:OB-fold domain-containing protein [Bacillus sp. 31A1R]|uniref:OB-fold domain-containing protein n=1 Tax=Robertmurraya mangrovi TaxID=3098077 RepID=A0ABU5IW33_9BACI|nr:OB-fold domain-containing protein [Bacillus sp. 31A1R]MDZ5471357.1 OB-fold domain-containing protein [Bacillus sp. 31A1R]
MAHIPVHECAQCQKKYVQRKWVCSNCKSTEFHLTEVPGEGTVFTHTTIHVSSSEFAHLAPYTVALVELADGLRVTGRVTGKVEINDQVTCVSNEENLYVFDRVEKAAG